MEKTKKTLKNLIFFILLIILTFYILLKDQNMDDIYNVLMNVNIWYVFIAIACMLLYLVLEGINLGRTLKVLDENSSFLKNLKYAFIGFFFSSITPAASGGQPMQIYYMYKDKISIANSTLALLLNLCSFQIVTISAAIISVIFNGRYLTDGLIFFFIIGVALNATALILLLIGIFSKRLSCALVNFAVNILKFFKIRNIEKKQENLEGLLQKYHGSAKYIKSNRPVIAKLLLTTCIQVLIYYSIPYWIYCSFGLTSSNIIEILGMQTLLYATVSGIPSPGAVGVSEGGFVAIFKTVFPTTMISGAMLLNRGVSFYLFVLISAVLVAITSFKSKKAENTDEVSSSKD